jgi:CBS domain containing-hemolysin-like protein
MSPIAIISIIALLVFAGFLAASESALTSISRVVIEEIEGKRGTALLRKCLFESCVSSLQQSC